MSVVGIEPFPLPFSPLRGEILCRGSLQQFFINNTFSPNGEGTRYLSLKLSVPLGLIHRHRAGFGHFADVRGGCVCALLACWPERLVGMIRPGYLRCGGLSRHSTSCTGGESCGLLSHGPLSHEGNPRELWEERSPGRPRWADPVPMLRATSCAARLPPAHGLLAGIALLLCVRGAREPHESPLCWLLQAHGKLFLPYREAFLALAASPSHLTHFWLWSTFSLIASALLSCCLQRES